MRDNDLSTTQRVAIVIQLLQRSRRPVKTAQVASLTGLTHAGAWALLNRVGSVMPVVLDRDGWRIIGKDEK